METLGTIGVSGFNHYQLLNVARNAAPDDIRRAYVRLLKHTHPDLVGQSRRPGARLEDVQRAYRCLLDPEARGAYDRALSEAELAHTARLQRVRRRLKKRELPYRDSAPRLPMRLNRRVALILLIAVAALIKLRADPGAF